MPARFFLYISKINEEPADQDYPSTCVCRYHNQEVRLSHVFILSLFSLVKVRDRAINTLVEIYRHVGEKVRIDLAKKGIPSSR